MSNYEIERTDELYHYGRKGMKWGQHIFGKVKAGASRAGKAIGSGASKAGHKISDSIRDRRARKKAEKLRAKPLSKLTDEELKERIKRLNLEKQATDIMRQTSGVDAKAVSAGKKILSRAATDVMAPVAIDVGKKWLTKALSKTLGLDGVDDAMSKLSKEAEKWGLEEKIAKAKAAVKAAESGKLDEMAALELQAKVAGYNKTIDDSKKSRLELDDKLNKRAADSSGNNSSNTQSANSKPNNNQSANGNPQSDKKSKKAQKALEKATNTKMSDIDNDDVSETLSFLKDKDWDFH